MTATNMCSIFCGFSVSPPLKMVVQPPLPPKGLQACLESIAMVINCQRKKLKCEESPRKNHFQGSLFVSLHLRSYNWRTIGPLITILASEDLNKRP